MTFDNVIIVIGASQGIGRHIVKQLGKAFKSPAWKVNKVNYQLYWIMFAAEKGCEVVIVDKSAEKVDKIRDEIVSKGGSAHSVPFNITNNSLVDQFSQLLDAAFQQVM